MREIKFRAWDKDGSGMFSWQKLLIYPSLIHELLTDKETAFVLMQYTGLHDKNDKEIYEGDIVKTQFMGKWLISAVTWKDYAWTLKDGKGELHDMIVYDAFHGGGEVIGDKWENPELLEKK